MRSLCKPRTLRKRATAWNVKRSQPRLVLMADEKLAEDAAAALEGKYAPYHFKRTGIRE